MYLRQWELFSYGALGSGAIVTGTVLAQLHARRALGLNCQSKKKNASYFSAVLDLVYPPLIQRHVHYKRVVIEQLREPASARGFIGNYLTYVTLSTKQADSAIAHPMAHMTNYKIVHQRRL